MLGGGSEDRFAQMMTLSARALGMTRTTFRNASGLPDLDQVTTARDMALLGRRLMHDFPDRYSYFSTPHFVFRGRTHWNHNRLLQRVRGRGRHQDRLRQRQRLQPGGQRPARRACGWWPRCSAAAPGASATAT